MIHDWYFFDAGMSELVRLVRRYVCFITFIRDDVHFV